MGSTSPEKQTSSAAGRCSTPSSPSKVRNVSLAEFVRSTSPSKPTSMQDDAPTPACKLPTHSANTSIPPPPPPLPPVVVSCMAKSPCSSPTRLPDRVPSPDMKPCLAKSTRSSPAHQLNRVYSPEAKAVKVGK